MSKKEKRKITGRCNENSTPTAPKSSDKALHSVCCQRQLPDLNCRNGRCGGQSHHYSDGHQTCSKNATKNHSQACQTSSHLIPYQTITEIHFHGSSNKCFQSPKTHKRINIKLGFTIFPTHPQFLCFSFFTQIGFILSQISTILPKELSQSLGIIRIDI